MKYADMCVFNNLVYIARIINGNTSVARQVKLRGLGGDFDKLKCVFLI